MVITAADNTNTPHNILTDTVGRIITVMRGADDPKRKYVQLANVNETTIWDPTAGTKWVITDLVVWASANATVTFRDGTGGTTWLTYRLLAGVGMPINFQTPIVSAAADNNLTAQTTAATVDITVSGYEL